MRRRKSWREKLADDKGLPKVMEITPKMSTRWGEGSVVVPAAIEVDELMKQVPEGKLVTIQEIRTALARKHHATIGCPMVTGIFAWVAAHAAEEAAKEGEKNITPWWRTLKVGGEINPKYPGGVPAVADRLKAEGHSIVQRGQRYFVKDYQTAVAHN